MSDQTSYTRSGMAVFAAIVLMALSACTNGSLVSRNPSTTTGAGGTSGVITPPVNEDPGFVLSQVLRTSTDPYNKLDLIGDGTGSFAEWCTATDAAGAASTCSCSYSYITPAGDSLTVEEATVYREMDLIRCSYTNVPRDIAYVKVRIHHTGGSYSNEITLPLTGSGAVTNLSDSSSYVSFKRYQCRDAVVIPSSLFASGSTYDPIQSEDSRLTYPLNFYTTNYASALNAFSQNAATKPSSGGSGWICPLDPSKSTTASGFDLSLYSEVPLAGNYTMFPASTSDDRVNFVVPPVSTGVFSIPVNAYYAPLLNTTIGGSGTNKPMGYGAAPLPNGDGTEGCPDTSVVIPSGYQWVKVWQFRATLEPRRFRVNAEFAATGGGITCDPGLIQLSGANYWIPTLANGPNTLVKNPNVNACQGRAVAGNSTWNHYASGELQGRWIATNLNGAPACFNPASANNTGQRIAGGTTRPTLLPTWYWSSVPTASQDYQHLTPGSDFWIHNAMSDCGKTTSTDGILGPYKLCAQAPAVQPQSVAWADGGGGAPVSLSTSFEPLDGSTSRYDYLLVVTPVNVHTRDFKDQNATAKQYTPFRYYSPYDCPSGNPTDPGCGDPDKMIKYGITFHDLSTNPDSSVPVDGRLPTFPVCALQKIP